MGSSPLKAKDINDYISNFPVETQQILGQLRQVIKNTVPKAAEVISYGMPAFKINKVLVYFAGYKNHIGFYPTPSAIEKFQKELSVYKTSKGAVQFPLDKPLPVKLISEIVKFRKKADKEAAAAKNKMPK